MTYSHRNRCGHVYWLQKAKTRTAWGQKSRPKRKSLRGRGPVRAVER